MDLEIIPGSVEHLQKLIEGSDAFQAAYGWQVVDGYLPFAGALQYSLNQIEASEIWAPWLPYLFLLPAEGRLVGIGGFTGVPDANRTVEIGYAIAPTYQGRGLATAAARQLVEIAFSSKLVDCVCAHTLAIPNPSTRVLEKCGMTKVSEMITPEDGKVWRWELRRNFSPAELESP